MKQRVLVTTTLVILGTVVFTTVLAHAQTTSNGPYYATPSWDQQLQCDTLATCPRFIVLSNWIDAVHPSGGAAVLDRETGLVWEQNPGSFTVNWVTAIFETGSGSTCVRRPTGGRTGWRLPRVEELASLNTGPTSDLPSGHPFGSNASGTFWSATTSPLDSTRAVVYPIACSGAGCSFGEFPKGESHKVWCVRSPSPGFVGQ